MPRISHPQSDAVAGRVEVTCCINNVRSGHRHEWSSGVEFQICSGQTFGHDCGWQPGERTVGPSLLKEILGGDLKWHLFASGLRSSSSSERSTIVAED
jgi:hypothetical protein